MLLLQTRKAVMLCGQDNTTGADAARQRIFVLYRQIPAFFVAYRLHFSLSLLFHRADF